MITSSPFQEAVDRMKGRTPIAVALRSDEWADVPLELRDRAFWTAQFASMHALQLMHDEITKALEMGKDEQGRFVTRSTFVGKIRQALQDAGYVAPVGKEGSLQDHSSLGRLGLIFDINESMAHEFGRWKSSQTSSMLDAYPCRELIRVASRKVPRHWIERWRAAGGRFYGPHMIAQVNDPIWSTISRFGNPYPPFDYNSGMGTREVSRPEAERLGAIRPGEMVAPVERGFNDSLSASVKDTSPSLVEAILSNFGGSVAAKNDTASWVGEKTIPVPPALRVDEAIKKLSSPYTIEDSDGEEVIFGPRVLEYFNKAQGKKDDRLKSLNWAEETVRSGTKSVLADRTVYTQTFTPPTGKEKGLITLVSLPSGEVFNFYRKPANKMSTMPDGSTRSALPMVESLPTPLGANRNLAQNNPEVNP